MADTKISALTAVTVPAATDEFAVNQGGASKKVTAALLGQYLNQGQATKVVASNDAPAQQKIAADYLCDGTADEVQINAAITALGSLGGKVRLTGGRFFLAAPILIADHGIILEGDGWGDPLGWTEDAYGTQLYPAGGFTGGALIIAATGAFGTSNPVAACQIRNLMCDGGAGTTTPVGTGIDGIQFSSFSGLIENVRTVFMSGDGIHVSGKTTATTWSTYDTTIAGIITHHNTGAGLLLDNFAEDVQVTRVVAHQNSGDGIRSNGSSNQFLQCHSYDNGFGTNYNIRIGSGAARCKLVGNKIEHAEGIGVLNEGSETLFSGNSFHSNGDPSGGTGTRHIQSTGGSALIVGNKFGIKGSTYSMGNAIEIVSGATGCYIVSNLFQGTYNNTGGAILNSASAVVFGNTGSSVVSNVGNLRAVPFIIDGGGSAITTGIKGDVRIPFAGTIERVVMLADQTGSVVVDIWKDTYANAPPTDADSITASAPPTISSAAKSEDSTLTGWTTAIAAGDVIRYNVDSATTIQRVTVELYVRETV